MAGKQRAPILTALFVIDLACFCLGGMGYGESWSIAGVIGLVTFLVLFEVL